MGEVIQFEKSRRTQSKKHKGGAAISATPGSHKKTAKIGRNGPFATGTLSMPLVQEMMRSVPAPPPLPPGPSLLESGVLAFRRQKNGEPLVLLISKKRSKNWGIPKGKVVAHLSFSENAAKEAYEEAGVVGDISPLSVGMFRSRKRTPEVPSDRIMEVWVYLLEVTEMLADWPEKRKRKVRWVSCETAAKQLREPALVHLCHRLAQN